MEYDGFVFVLRTPSPSPLPFPHKFGPGILFYAPQSYKFAQSCSPYREKEERAEQAFLKNTEAVPWDCDVMTMLWLQGRAKVGVKVAWILHMYIL